MDLAILTAVHPELIRIAAGQHHDPHSLLGPHDAGVKTVVTAYLPCTRSAGIAGGRPLARVGHSDFFTLEAQPGSLPRHPRLRWIDDSGHAHERVDPYSFDPSLSAADLELFAGGNHVEAWRMLGAHPASFGGI